MEWEKMPVVLVIYFPPDKHMSNERFRNERSIFLLPFANSVADHAIFVIYVNISYVPKLTGN